MIMQLVFACKLTVEVSSFILTGLSVLDFNADRSCYKRNTPIVDFSHLSSLDFVEKTRKLSAGFAY